VFLDRRLEWYKAANVRVFTDDSKGLGELRLSFSTATVGVIEVGELARNDAVDIELLIAAVCFGDGAPVASSIKTLQATSPSILFSYASFIIIY